MLSSWSRLGACRLARTAAAAGRKYATSADDFVLTEFSQKYLGYRKVSFENLIKTSS